MADKQENYSPILADAMNAWAEANPEEYRRILATEGGWETLRDRIDKEIKKEYRRRHQLLKERLGEEPAGLDLHELEEMLYRDFTDPVYR